MKTRLLLLGMLFCGILNAQDVESSSSRTIGGNNAGFSSPPSQCVIYGANAGYNANSALSSARKNSFIGHQSGYSVTSGGSNTFLGAWTGYYTTTGQGNIFLGSNAGYNNTTGTGNIIIGSSTNGNTTGSNNIFIGTTFNSTTSSDLLAIGETSVSGTPLVWGDFVNDQVRLNGKVGIGMTIGTAFPTASSGVSVTGYKLFVKGGILADEVRVSTTWADYVFEDDYKLPTLAEVEQHIKEKGHLINVPSAKQVEAEGIEVGKMAKIQQEKIEELTLYIIEQNKINEKQATEIAELKAMVGVLAKTKQ